MGYVNPKLYVIAEHLTPLSQCCVHTFLQHDDNMQYKCGICYCPVSVCPSHRCIYRNGWMNRAVFLAKMLPSACPTLCFNEIQDSPNIRALLSGTLSQTLNLADFHAFFRHGTSTVASAVNLVLPSQKFISSSVRFRLHHVDRDTQR